MGAFAAVQHNMADCGLKADLLCNGLNSDTERTHKSFPAYHADEDRNHGFIRTLGYRVVMPRRPQRVRAIVLAAVAVFVVVEVDTITVALAITVTIKVAVVRGLYCHAAHEKQWQTTAK